MVAQAAADPLMATPDIKVKVRQTFGIDSDLEVPAFSKCGEHVPDVDEAYRFDPQTTIAICAAPAKCTTWSAVWPFAEASDRARAKPSR